MMNSKLRFISLLRITGLFVSLYPFLLQGQVVDNSLHFNGRDTKILIPYKESLNVKSEITLAFKIKITDTSFSNKPQIILSNRGYNQLKDFKDIKNWQVYNATNATKKNDIRGFVGAVFDGRYIYFSPWWKGETQSGKILKYDTKNSFEKSESWDIYNAENQIGDGNIRGLEGAVFDGRFIYFVPLHHDGTYFSKVLRYDTEASFQNSLSWDVYEIGIAGAKGFTGAVFDGTYIYFIPNSFKPHLKTIRYNVRKDFHASDSWEVFDAKVLPIPNLSGFFGGIFDGKYVYLIPFGCRYIVRYNTEFPFGAEAAWEYFDPHKTSLNDPISLNYSGAVFDGRYIYFSSVESGNMLRFDSKSDFESESSWKFISVLDKGGIKNLSGGVGPVFDGRYIFFPPMHEARIQGRRSGRFIIYDTEREFQNVESWDFVDMEKHDSTLVGFEGGVFDGKNIYFSPMNFGNSHGKILKYDTKDITDGYSITLNQNSSSFGSVLHGLTFNIGTKCGLRNITLDPKFNLKDGKWHDVVAFYDGKKMGLILDGHLKSEVKYQQEAEISGGERDLFIGGDISINSVFNGYLDEVMIWSKSFDNKLSGLARKEPLASWRFNEVGGDIIKDEGLNKLHGTLLNNGNRIDNRLLPPVQKKGPRFVCETFLDIYWESITSTDSSIVQLTTDKEFAFILNEIKIRNQTLLLKELKLGKTYYWRVASIRDKIQSEWSGIERFSTLETPTLTAQTKNMTIEEGASVSLETKVHSMDNVKYQWSFNDKNIQESASSQYLIVKANTNQSGLYSCRFENQCGHGDISPIYLIVDPKIKE